MAIKGVSDILRLPRLDKIRLGIMVETPGKHPRPKAVDYFVCPPEVREVFGEEPRELQIMFPVENPDEFAQQFLRAYSLTQGLICIGDGISRRQKVDTTTKKHADHNTQDWEWVVGEVCDPQECNLYAEKRCRRVLNLQFLLPRVPGLGVWQIDTTSFYSIVNINSMIALVKNLCGRISMVPLTLCLGPIEVSPKGLKKKTVYVMHIKQDVRLADLQRLALTPPAQMLVIPEPEVDEAPSDLYPDIVEGETVEEKGETVEAKGETVEKEKQQVEPARDTTQERLIAGWSLIRKTQKDLDLDDGYLKSAFKNQFPILRGKIPRTALPDEPPDWTNLDQVIAMAKRLAAYQQKIAELGAELPDAAPTEPTAAVLTEPDEGDHPWDKTKRGEDPGGQPPPEDQPGGGTPPGTKDELDS